MHLAHIAFVQAVGCIRQLRQFPAAGKMIGMDVGVDDKGDAHRRLLRLLHEPRFVASHDIHCHRRTLAAASIEVGQGPVGATPLFEKHRPSH
jgi:hypothetical protein